jgi:hypothetical protein
MVLSAPEKHFGRAFLNLLTPPSPSGSYTLLDKQPEPYHQKGNIFEMVNGRFASCGHGSGSGTVAAEGRIK